MAAAARKAGEDGSKTLEELGHEITRDEFFAWKARMDAKVRSLGEINRCLSAENQRLLGLLLRAERQIAILGHARRKK